MDEDVPQRAPVGWVTFVLRTNGRCGARFFVLCADTIGLFFFINKNNYYKYGLFVEKYSVKFEV